MTLADGGLFSRSTLKAWGTRDPRTSPACSRRCGRRPGRCRIAGGEPGGALVGMGQSVGRGMRLGPGSIGGTPNGFAQ